MSTRLNIILPRNLHAAKPLVWDITRREGERFIRCARRLGGAATNGAEHVFFPTRLGNQQGRQNLTGRSSGPGITHNGFYGVNHFRQRKRWGGS